MALCYPWWHNQFLRFRGVTYPGGYSVPDDPEAVAPALRAQGLEDFVPVDPEALRANAERQLRALGIWTRAEPLSQVAYDLARNAAAEIGHGTAEEKVLLIQSTMNHARKKGVDVHQVVTGNRRWPNHYGRIHFHGDPAQGSPYGRFTATTREPSAEDIMIAVFVLEGGAGTFPNDFSRGADDQAQANSESWVLKQAAQRSYWVDLLPGVNDFRIRGFRSLPSVDPQSPLGRQLVARAIARLRGELGPKGEVLVDCIEASPAVSVFASLSPAKKVAFGVFTGLSVLLAGVAIASFIPRAPAPRRAPRRASAAA